MKTRNFDDFIRRDIERDMAYHERLQSKQQPPQKPPAPQPAAHFLSQVPDAPLTWLWPGHTPQGHLTLLDAVPGSGLSLLALTLAARVSSDSPLSDGTPTQQGHLILLPLTTRPPTSSNRACKPPEAIRTMACSCIPSSVMLPRSPT